MHGIILREIKYELLNHFPYLETHSKLPKSHCDLHIKSITINHKILLCETKKDAWLSLPRLPGYLYLSLLFAVCHEYLKG